MLCKPRPTRTTAFPAGGFSGVFLVWILKKLCPRRRVTGAVTDHRLFFHQKQHKFPPRAAGKKWRIWSRLYTPLPTR